MNNTIYYTPHLEVAEAFSTKMKNKKKCSVKKYANPESKKKGAKR
jgi:hypothetical protein